MAGGSGGIKAGKAYVELSIRSSVEKGLKAAEKQLKSFGSAISSVGIKLAAVGAAGVTAAFGLVKSFSNVGDQFDKASKRTGITVEALSELAFAAEDSGASLETMEAGIRKMQQQLTDAAGGSKSAVKAFEALGLSVADLQGLSPDQQFLAVAEAVSRIEDPTTKAAVAMDVLGKSGTQLLPMFENGAEGIEVMRKRARDLNLVMSGEAASAAALFGDTLSALLQTLGAVARTIATALMPVLTPMIEAAAQWVATASRWIQQNQALVVSVFKIFGVITALGVGLIAIGTIISTLGSSLGALAGLLAVGAKAFALIGTIIGTIFSPIGLLISAIIGIGAAIAYTTDYGQKALEFLGGIFAGLKDTAVKAFKGIGDALATGNIAAAAKILWLALKLEWQKGLDTLDKLWFALTDGFIAAWTDAVQFFAKIFITGISVLKVAWANFTEFARNLWNSVTASVGNAFDRWWANLKQGANEVLADTGIITAAERNQRNASAESEGQRAIRERTAAFEESKKQIAAEAQADRQSAVGTAQGQFDLLRKEKEAAEKKRIDDLNAKANSTNTDLEAARREFNDATAAAASEREAVQTSSAPEAGGFNFKLEDIFNKITAGVGVAADVENKRSSRGTFNAAAIAGLQTQGQDSRIADATEQTARNTKKLIQSVEKNAPTFA